MAEGVASELRPTAAEVVIQGGLRRSTLRAVQELFHERELVLALVQRSVKLRYRQAFFGFAWAVVQPAAYLAAFAIVFGRLVHVDGGGGLGYAAFAVTALVPWQFVSNGVVTGSQAIVNDAPLLRKIYFPREAPVIGALGASSLDFAVGIAMMLIAAPLFGAHEGWNTLFLPLVVVPLVVLTLAISLAAAAVNVYFRDVRYVLTFGVQLWLFVSPVAYPITRVPKNARWLYAVVNPLVGPLEAFRRTVGLGLAPDWTLLALSSASTLVALVAALALFRRLEPGFSDTV